MNNNNIAAAAALADLNAPGSKASSMAQASSASAKPTAKAGRKKPKKGGKKKVVHKFPIEPTLIKAVERPRDYMNHSYRDFSKVPAEIGHEVPQKIEDMTFSQKVHHILSQDQYKKWIGWLPHGRAFKISVPVYFERNVCEKYFGHKRYSSFLRQLNNFGFKHITKGPDRNSYYHECMLKDLPHLCIYMPEGKDARRLIPDPENEPDFYAIANAYPLGKTAVVPEEKKMPAQPKPAQAPQLALPSYALEAPSVASVSVAAASSGSVLQPRLASDVDWLARQLPPAKLQRPSIGQEQPIPQIQNAAVAAAVQHVVDVAEARRRQEATIAAALEQMRKQKEQEQQQQLAASLLGDASQAAQLLSDPTKTAALFEYLRMLQR